MLVELLTVGEKRLNTRTNKGLGSRGKVVLHFGLDESDMDLKEKIEMVASKRDFVKFLTDLRRNLIAHPEEWGNNTLERFLEALSAWTEDMDGYYENHHLPVPAVPSWKVLAEMFLASKYYE